MRGYDFVPLPEEIERTTEAPEVMRLDRRVPGTWFGTIELHADCIQPVHVGAGYKRVENGYAVRAMTRRGADLVIPGTTMKGFLRARHEALTKSCALWMPKEGRSRSRTYPTVKTARFSGDAKSHPAFQPCRRDSVCPTCALFGFQSGQKGQQGRISTTDLVLLSGVAPETRTVPAQWEPRLHHLGPFEIKNDEFEVKSFTGRKFARGPTHKSNEGAQQRVEVIPAGTKLMGTLRLFNVTNAELGALWAALGLLPEGPVKIGGAKAYGLGRVKLSPGASRLKDANRKRRAPDPEGWRAAFVASKARFEAGEKALFELHRGAEV